MSADNYYTVKFDMKRGGFIVRMGFASDDLPVFARGDEELFDSNEAALDEAFRRDEEHPSEYGVGPDSVGYRGICYPDQYREWAESLIAFHTRNLEALDEGES